MTIIYNDDQCVGDGYNYNESSALLHPCGVVYYVCIAIAFQMAEKGTRNWREGFSSFFFNVYPDMILFLAQTSKMEKTDNFFAPALLFIFEFLRILDCMRVNENGKVVFGPIGMGRSDLKEFAWICKA